MRPTIPEVLPLVEKLYEEHATGCCLHIVLDDGNVEDSSIQFCIKYAKERNHVDCLKLAEILLKMSKTQRLKLYKL